MWRYIPAKAKALARLTAEVTVFDTVDRCSANTTTSLAILGNTLSVRNYGDDDTVTKTQGDSYLDSQPLQKKIQNEGLLSVTPNNDATLKM